MTAPVLSVRLFLVDHHHAYRASLRTELSRAFDLVGEAGTADAAADEILRARPDVVLLDVFVHGGAALIGTVHALDPNVQFLAMSVTETAYEVMDAMRAGARGHVRKAAPATGLTRAILAVHAGDVVVPPRLAGFLLATFGTPLAAETGAATHGLSPVQRRVLRGLARGLTRDEIAHELSVPVDAVTAYLSATVDQLRLLAKQGRLP